MAAERPNILLIQSDQHRWDCSPCAPNSRASTPALDRLAREGVRFTHAFTPIPLCCPARQSLLCGEWPEVHGGLWNYDTCLPVRSFESPTWTDGLRAAGYRIGYVGKWHVDPVRGPEAFGFQIWHRLEEYESERRRWGVGTLRPDEKGPWWIGGVDPAPLERTRTHWCAERAAGLMAAFAGSGSPWHVRLDFDEPHFPCFPTERFTRLYDPSALAPWGSFGDRMEGKPFMHRQQLLNWGVQGLGWEVWSRYLARYLATVSQVDDAVGRVLRALEETGQADRTLVIFTSDHGDAAGSHGHVDKHYVMYDDVVRVPLVLRWPGVTTPGSSSDRFVLNALDLAATCSEAGGIAAPAGCQGRSLLPIARGEQPAAWRKSVAATYNGNQFGLYTQRMLRTERHKYVWNATDMDELYDLWEDPWEMRNLAQRPDHRELLATMRRDLHEELAAHGDTIGMPGWRQVQLLAGRKATMGGAGTTVEETC